ncbi:hypothetical protein HYY69_02825 [Candidatus Woesearchaeota archaeon]|nr:hypothetical protein [Candidatus Woesearchaeota archaeon]
MTELAEIVERLDRGMQERLGFFKQPQPFEGYDITYQKTLYSGPLRVSIRQGKTRSSLAIPIEVHIAYRYSRDGLPQPFADAVDIGRETLDDINPHASIVVPNVDDLRAYFRGLDIGCTIHFITEGPEQGMMQTTYTLDFKPVSIANTGRIAYHLEKFIKYVRDHADLQLKMLHQGH